MQYHLSPTVAKRAVGRRREGRVRGDRDGGWWGVGRGIRFIVKAEREAREHRKEEIKIPSFKPNFQSSVLRSKPRATATQRQLCPGAGGSWDRVMEEECPGCPAQSRAALRLKAPFSPTADVLPTQIPSQPP